MKKCLQQILLVVVLLSLGDSAAVEDQIKVETLTATSQQRGSVSLIGGIHANGEPIQFYFEYGPSKNYSHKTTLREVAPHLGAYYHESWDVEMEEQDTRMKSKHIKKWSSNEGFVRFLGLKSIGHRDDNHLKMKILYLLLWRYIGPMENGISLYLGGGKADFRNAQVTIKIRGNNFVPNGAEFLWWEQSQINADTQAEDGLTKNANWAYTGFPLTKYLLDGRWHTVTFTLHSDPTKWTYAGNNPNQYPVLNPDRYSYMPLGRTLREQNVDFLLVLAYVDKDHEPKGSIDLDELTIVYPNKSLVFEPNGGELVDYPIGAPDSPDSLTDGWRFGKGRMWKSEKNPEGPLEFLYRFPKEVTVETVQIHQNPDYPAKNIEVLSSSNGKEFSSVAEGIVPLPEKGKENYAFFIKDRLQRKAQYIKVVVKSGYQDEYWGLGEIEVFGKGIDLPSDDDFHYVNRDIQDIEPGKYHYRLVVLAGGRKYFGQDKVFTVYY